jgi:hypothetical protein
MSMDNGDDSNMSEKKGDAKNIAWEWVNTLSWRELDRLDGHFLLPSSLEDAESRREARSPIQISLSKEVGMDEDTVSNFSTPLRHIGIYQGSADGGVGQDFTLASGDMESLVGRVDRLAAENSRLTQQAKDSFSSI